MLLGPRLIFEELPHKMKVGRDKSQRLHFGMQVRTRASKIQQISHALVVFIEYLPGRSSLSVCGWNEWICMNRF